MKDLPLDYDLADPIPWPNGFVYYFLLILLPTSILFLCYPRSTKSDKITDLTLSLQVFSGAI